ncbi:PDR/VanB family oxidoreductase [Streptomyces sp. JV176]|uniref:PDR/VanB family oxidoreductase n=1 Tax=Streptomyces sp. JV176 TaxID=858630 RepID=UPI002E77A023|nr:PDR/VanB family oxidoreductase [Streptomyces sp. JV176]MEE1800630.1 PDR/VanB family oxidoreductase [Streptomyces sp. JV176]
MTGTDRAPEAELDLVVTRRTDEADGVVSLVLRRPDGGDLPVWEPGAHVDLLLDGRDAAAGASGQAGPEGLTRPYSLCSSPGDRGTWRIAVLREPAGRGGSAHVHDRLAEGDTVRVRGPRNHFELAPSPAYLFLAGGIGITPLVPMVEEAERHGRTWELVYGGRALGSMAFREELRGRYGDRVRPWPEETHGLLDLDTLLGTPRPGTLVYCCGPEPLLKAVEEACRKWPEGALRVERFTPGERTAPVRDGTFEIDLARTGRTLAVPPGKSVLDVVEAAGVEVLTSCREGTCGTCETEVLAGEVDHRDSLLTPAERAANDTMMICVSRAACPKLVLDL